MSVKCACPVCGDYNYATDPVCLSCGGELRAPVTAPALVAPAPVVADSSPADWDISAPDPARAERLARARELAVQVEALIQQGYHTLPKEPDARYGPADDVSDLCREIGECHMRNDDYEDAVGWLGRALVIAPQNTVARAYLVGCLCRLSRFEEAKAWFDETPGDPIDRNIVRSWLELRREGAGAPSRSSCAVRPTATHLPSARDRSLSLHVEPRSA
jgi:tetratricopeptide (TPR) repeat protein